MAICSHILRTHTQHKQQSVKLPYSFVTNKNIDVIKELAYNTVKPIESTSIDFTLVQFRSFWCDFSHLFVSVPVLGLAIPTDWSYQQMSAAYVQSDRCSPAVLIIRLAPSWWVILCDRYLRADSTQSAPRPIFPFLYQFKGKFEMAKFVIWTKNQND